MLKKITGWIVFVLILVSAGLIAYVPERNVFFIVFQLLVIIGVLAFRKSFDISLIGLSRTIIGLLFIFSGFVKGVDPIGTEYRIEDYFMAFGTHWAIPYSLTLSVILNGAEFLLGVLLLLNVRPKLTAWLVVFMMLVFTVVTINDALNNPVPDCGCFGDALVISNWQTLYKNLVIDALLLIVFLNITRIKPWFSLKTDLAIAFLFALGFTFFQIYNVRHLPVLDFRSWKVGNRMAHENPLPKKYYLTYQNKNTGETKEYLSPDYPYNDSVWVKTWEFVSQRVIDPNPPLHDLSLNDAEGNDYTAAIVENPGKQYLIVAYDLDQASLKKVDEIRAFIDECNNEGISIALITSTIPDLAEEFIQQKALAIDVYFTDDIALKTMIRSNPGLILLENGRVIDKWHYNDWPSSIN